MKTPRLPASVNSQHTAKRPAFGLLAMSTKAKTLTTIQTIAAAASNIAPGVSSQRLTRSARCSNANGAPPIAKIAAASAGSGARGAIASA